MRILSLFACSFILFALTSGCEQKEEVLDIETPAGDIKVERSVESDAVDVEIEK